jgi:hypothetical protein
LTWIYCGFLALGQYDIPSTLAGMSNASAYSIIDDCNLVMQIALEKGRFFDLKNSCKTKTNIYTLEDNFYIVLK